MKNELKNITDTKILREEELHLSEEIADLTEIIFEETMSAKSRERMTERVKELSEKRNQIRSALTPHDQSVST